MITSRRILEFKVSKWPSWSTVLYDSKEELKQAEDIADVIILCGEDTHHLHSRRLADKSSFFKTALDIPMVEKKENKIEIKEVDPKIFKKVINYMYEERLEFDKETELSQILDAADHFDMEEL